MSRIGPRAIAVPSLVQGLWDLHQKYGSLEWKELVKPAIRLCRDGVEVGPAHRRMLQIVAPRLANFPETARIQLDDGKIPPLGWKLQAARPREDARAGRREGRPRRSRRARSRARSCRRAAGRSRSTTSRATARSGARRFAASTAASQLVSMPPPSSGGVLLVEMLNALTPYDLPKLGLNSSEEINLVAGAMKLAFSDRAVYLGDPDYWTVPTEKLISKEYGAELAEELRTPPFFLRAPWNWGKPGLPEGARAARRRRRPTPARHRSRSSTRRATRCRSPRR